MVRIIGRVTQKPEMTLTIFHAVLLADVESARRVRRTAEAYADALAWALRTVAAANSTDTRGLTDLHAQTIAERFGLPGLLARGPLFQAVRALRQSRGVGKRRPRLKGAAADLSAAAPLGPHYFCARGACRIRSLARIALPVAVPASTSAPVSGRGRAVPRVTLGMRVLSYEPCANWPLSEGEAMVTWLPVAQAKGFWLYHEAVSVPRLGHEALEILDWVREAAGSSVLYEETLLGAASLPVSVFD